MDEHDVFIVEWGLGPRTKQERTMAIGYLVKIRTLGCFGGLGIGMLVSLFLMSAAEKTARSPDEALWVAFFSFYLLWPACAAVGAAIAPIVIRWFRKNNEGGDE